MPVPLGQFVKCLTDSGLMPSDEVRAFQERLPPRHRPADGKALARELVERGRLTRYQAASVYQGKITSLVFGDYIVLDRIGSGGMGRILKAQHRRMQRIVALKVLNSAALKSPQLVKRFQREVRAAATLTHPNIVTAYDADEANGVHFLVMEYVDGYDLNALLKKRGPLPVAQAVDYMLQAARGLEYAHEQGLVHRDIKPGNVLVDRRGTVKILDMGLARFEEGAAAGVGDERLTVQGSIIGTADYMPPEQTEDATTADRRSDLYSLGCTLYRILTGRHVYSGESLMDRLMAHRDQPIPSLCDARPDVAPALDAIFRRMVAKMPDDRYQSATELIRDLELYLGRTVTMEQRVRPVAVSTAAAASESGQLAELFKHMDARASETRAKGSLENTEDRTPSEASPSPWTSLWSQRLEPALQQKHIGWILIAAGGIALALAIVLLVWLGLK